MNYKKDYSGESAEYWLSIRKWTGFLINVPIDEEKIYYCPSPQDILSIRSTASQMSNDPDCDRTFSIYTDLAKGEIKVTAKLKDNGQVNPDPSE